MKTSAALLAIAMCFVSTLSAQTPSPTPAPAPAATPAPEDPEKSAQEKAAEDRKTLDLLRRLRISGYIQAQYVEDESSKDELTGSASTRNRDQFSVRRGRIKFTYQMAPTARFVLQPDITSSGVTLKDGYLELIEPWTSWKNTLTAGQFTWPFGFELVYSSSNREMPERSRVVRALFPGERDRGVQLSGRGFDGGLGYQIAIVNGTGTTQSTDSNRRKDVVGRLGWKVGALSGGVSGYEGEDLIATSASPEGAEFDKERAGFDVQWTTPLPGLSVRGEYITGSDRGRDVDGWYAYAIHRAGKRHQFVVRADEYDPDTDIGGDATFTLGGSYIFHWDTNTKLMLAYEHPKDESNDPDDDVVTVRLQYSF